ncbi:MAG: 4Fe-4S dicluster domain-containing protein [Sedimentisphaerales bacterium]|nr:4Fe-4S dicluster domain-containing protein [Sedimentisphaerales bacterium]
MDAVFVSKLKTLLDALAEKMDVYVPAKASKHLVFTKYDPGSSPAVEFNAVRTCTPVKEFLFPLRETAATMQTQAQVPALKAFAVVGLKDCDVRSIAILDKVFAEDDFKDALYVARREKMFIVSSDCTEPAQTCFCALFEGKGFTEKGFDLNISPIKGGFIVDIGSRKGHEFVERNSGLFADVPAALLEERDANRAAVQQQLERQSAEFIPSEPLQRILERTQDSEIFAQLAKDCIECQACTRVCPTCHCFYLYDGKQQDYFTKMKIWDSCMRFGYAMVAGGANPNKVLGERMKHRLMHKFVYFLERYGVNMCVGCGRCIDADAGGIDLRQVLKKLGEEARLQKTERAK